TGSRPRAPTSPDHPACTRPRSFPSRHSPHPPPEQHRQRQNQRPRKERGQGRGGEEQRLVAHDVHPFSCPSGHHHSDSPVSWNSATSVTPTHPHGSDVSASTCPHSRSVGTIRDGTS